MDEETWEWFDSYGMRPDSELKFVPPGFMAESDQTNIITQLVLAAQQETKLIWNQKDFQAHDKKIDTCGRWAALRIRKRKMSLAEFQTLFLSKENKLTADEYVTLLTMLYT